MYGELQQILGTDKRNPCFTVFRDEAGALLLFYGGELLETLSDDRNHAQYKLMVATLYNAGVNARYLQEAFHVARKTMRCWGRALENGDPAELARVLAGRQANRKLSAEILAYARVRFSHIYPENQRSYSKAIREEIAEVFNVELSAESLRPLFGKLRNAFSCDGEVYTQKEETPCDMLTPEHTQPVGDEPQNQAHSPLEPYVDEDPYRKGSPYLESDAGVSIRFSHHLGILLFSHVLLLVEGVGGDSGWLLKQWLCSILLGAVNIEQSKLLDLDGLAQIIGRTHKSRHPQREMLAGLATTSIADQLYKLNAELVGADQCNDFYYDPHTKQYTGGMKILKGWCGSRHFADKALHMDFIHTADGHPVHVSYDDNYDDLRTRYTTVISDMRFAQEMDKDRILTAVFDRGIFGQKTFNEIIEDPTLHFVTWEKGYPQGSWDPAAGTEHFTMHRTRNRANDFKIYRFEHQTQLWAKNTALRLIRVRATNPAGQTVELGILTDDAKRPAQESIRLMFRRWLQENDFKYMEKHFGINQITSYASHSYKELASGLEDRQVKSGEYKALQKERTQLRKKLKTELYNEHQHPDKSTPRTQRIATLSEADKALAKKMQATQREASRLDTLIQSQYRKLNTGSKKVYDALKLIARNAFYIELAPFKKCYDNYRDDHVIFRNLTCSPGLLTQAGTELKATLHPSAPHPPARRKLIEELFAQINQTGLTLPDGSDRPILLELGKKEGIELATRNPSITPI